ncbi:MAG: glycogen(starch) synthase [Parcubacteria bacterium C7867-005]|nr:MAG: glycogen(starch) synthase [Parcubacteria bacterium C7867-005]
MKRVLIFSLAYEPIVGGAEVAVRELTSRMTDIEFDMVTKKFSKEHKDVEKINNVTVYRIDTPKILFPIKAYLFGKKLHLEKSYNMIWSIMAAHAGFASLFFKYSFPKVPYVLTLQEGIPLEEIKSKARFVYPLFRRIFLKADVIQTISLFLANFAVSMGYKGRVEVIPNGVETAVFSRISDPSRLQSLLERMDKKEGDIYLITTSRLVKKNGVKDIIQSLVDLPGNIKLLIIGTGPLENSLKLLTKNLNLEARVMFLGHMSYEDVPLYLHASDIFIRPSLSEGFGNSFIEAMAAGLPVIATPVGGIVDFVFDPDKNKDKKPTGLFVKTENPESIVIQVKRLIKNKELRDSLIENGRRLVREKYEWDLVARYLKTLVFDGLL